MKRAFLLLLLALLVACLASLHMGLRFYTPATVWSALSGGQSVDEIIIRTLRLSRTTTGALSGAALALSGLLMQSATRNPLAEPGLLGVNAGAAFAVTLGLVGFAITGPVEIGALAILGALATTALVFGLSMALGPASGTATVLLIGVTFAAILASLTQVFLLLDETAMETLLFWLSGSFSERPLPLLWIGAITLPLALILCGWLSEGMDTLRLDDQSAQGIGVNVVQLRMIALGLAALLSAAAVSMSGPVVFLGLVAPHIARRLTPAFPGFFKLCLITALCGAVIAIFADILARLIVAPAEAPIGSVLALIGVPFLIHLLRGRKEVSL